MKKLTKMIVLLLVAGFSQAQSVERSVISSSGNSYSGPNLQVDYTIGEMMIATVINAGNILTQGFQQPEGLFVSVPESPYVSGNVLIYPNPTNGQFTLSYPDNYNSETTISLYNLAGQVVLTKKVSSAAGGRNTVNFDISNFSQGIYLLALPLENVKGEKKTMYHKINLIY